MRNKRIGLLAAALLASLLLLEVGARGLYRVTEGEPFPGADLRERLAPTLDPDRILRAPRALDPADGGRKITNKVIHPYLGYVFESPVPGTINRFGLPGIDPLEPPAPDEIRIAIGGGSVALQVLSSGSKALRSSLAPAFPGKRIEFVGLTLGGYKQPQQLMALAWMLSLGAHFDVVVNLDGFNEVVLPVAENLPLGIHASYPRSWDLYQAGALDAARTAYVTETRDLLEQQNRWRGLLGTGLVSWSAFALQVLDRVDRRIAQQIAEHDAAFRSTRNDADLGFQATGPFVRYANKAASLAATVEIWKRSSLQMRALAEASGAGYFHFLQPNQWVPGAKPFSGIERDQLRVKGRFEPRDVVPRAYPALGRAGAELRAQGTAFRSLTHLFRQERRTVYRDTCCHFNQLGIDAIAGAIGQAIASDLK
ncbi:MAG: hypothetical protein VX466_02255 [Myxococcota bacterium]|nr:hypothetical protein [Myxococcota bacterium]